MIDLYNDFFIMDNRLLFQHSRLLFQHSHLRKMIPKAVLAYV